jgi:hypothetical protein
VQKIDQAKNSRVGPSSTKPVPTGSPRQAPYNRNASVQLACAIFFTPVVENPKESSIFSCPSHARLTR